MTDILKRQDAINKLVDDDIDSFITGHQDGDDSYAASLLEYGHKGYADYTNDELASELQERFEVPLFLDSYKVIDDEQE